MDTQFPATPSIIFFDPLAELLGVGNGFFHYTFDDVVKLSGHACPTVAGAFLMAIRAMHALYGDETPRRGDIRVIVPGPVEEGVNGPVSQVFTLLTGAAATNGFKGLGGQYARCGLMDFASGPAGLFSFQRTDSGESVTVSYDPSGIPPDPDMGPLLQRIFQDDRDPTARRQFRVLWRKRVIEILTDAGEQTVTIGGK
jgi:hypothetical protein